MDDVFDVSPRRADESLEEWAQRINVENDYHPGEQPRARVNAEPYEPEAWQHVRLPYREE